MTNSRETYVLVCSDSTIYLVYFQLCFKQYRYLIHLFIDNNIIRCDESACVQEDELDPLLHSAVVDLATEEPDTGSFEKQKELGIFQMLDKLSEVTDNLLSR